MCNYHELQCLYYTTNVLIICRIMVTIQQWRAAIGQFAGGRKLAPSDVNVNTRTTDTRSPYGVDTIILLQCIYTIFAIYFYYYVVVMWN